MYCLKRLSTENISFQGYADAEKVQLMVANQAVEDYCFSKILMYIPDLKTDTDRLSDAIELLRNHRYRILNNQSLEASRSMGINWIAGKDITRIIHFQPFVFCILYAIHQIDMIIDYQSHFLFNCPRSLKHREIQNEMVGNKSVTGKYFNKTPSFSNQSVQ